MDLKEYFQANPEIAIAFSGGTDSAYLLYMAKQYAKKVDAIYCQSVFQPSFELEDAKKFCNKYHIPLTIIQVDILSVSQIRENPENRCYLCKRTMLHAILEKAQQLGYSVIADGTNASDLESERPGMRAIEELKVVSPLRLCNLTKDEVREHSDKLNLFTANKPSYSCLATRIPTETPITIGLLDIVEQCENYLHQLGFVDYRVRIYYDALLIQVPEEQYQRILEYRNEILMIFLQFRKRVILDLLPRSESTSKHLAPQTNSTSTQKEEPSLWNPKQLKEY
ncbi:MAG: ATP-dependent sacrificial sulfur transferase LarE [Lachnospiraceae bacterium]|nr:ATP-dependent sacrificial sulfur transferase LarE [Lachnospiraceae bacterium]